MSTFVASVRSFMADEDGVTALEYGMIAALIAAVIVMTVSSLGHKVDEAFQTIADALP